MKHSTPLDIELYPNYLLIVIGNKYYELRDSDDSFDKYTAQEINDEMKKPTFGFNSNSYDLPIIAGAIKKKWSVSKLKEISDWIIENNAKHWQTGREFGIDVPENWNHIDLIEPSPAVFVGLKKYGARMMSKSIQDLPYDPCASLISSQMDEIKSYCQNDISLTVDLFNAIKPRLELREKLTVKYKTDMLSKSDSQIAEAILRSELGRVSYPDKSQIKTIRYTAPLWLSFRSTELRQLVSDLEDEVFMLNKGGKPVLPKWFKPLAIGSQQFKMGLGGLHSMEKKQSVYALCGHLIDADVGSYYPNIIRNLGLHPEHLGEKFNSVYSKLIDQRIEAKHSGDKVVADGFKITLNGAYGKLGSTYSFLYSPDLLLAVTLTGQLALLMLIEMYDDAGIDVVSANTDGVVCHFGNDMLAKYNDVNDKWMFETGFDLEQTAYKSLHSRDCNNYLAIKPDGTSKGKGVFAQTSLMKDPAGSIIHEAVEQYLVNDIDIERTIYECKDVTKFIFARNATGGANWRGQDVGKTVRWVWSTTGEPVLSNKTGNKVANTDGAYVCQTLPGSVPRWIDYDKYIKAAYKLLNDIGIEL